MQRCSLRLETEGPRIEAGDTMRWYEAGRPKDVGGIAEKYNGTEYILAWATASHGDDRNPTLDKSLDHRPGTPAWTLRDARPTTDQLGQTVVQFTFDPEGGDLFAELTKDNLKKPMAIMLDNKIISAPIIQSQIRETGTIDGGSNGFSPKNSTIS